MLLILSYHQIRKSKYGLPLPFITEHFQYIADNFPIVTPGDPLLPNKLSVCLSFDDAYADIYCLLFPLLKKLSIPILLAVPTQFIIPTTKKPQEERLAIPYYQASNPSIYKEKAPFCTWEELQEMTASGLVHIASHTHSHTSLEKTFNFKEEIINSKKILEDKLNISVTSFVYPYGKFSYPLDKKIKQYYPYTFKIGQATNASWISKKSPLARISTDHLISPQDPFSSLWKYNLKYYLNIIRQWF